MQQGAPSSTRDWGLDAAPYTCWACTTTQQSLRRTASEDGERAMAHPLVSLVPDSFVVGNGVEDGGGEHHGHKVDGVHVGHDKLHDLRETRDVNMQRQ